MTERSRKHDLDADNRTIVERTDPLLGAVLDKRYRVDFRLAAGGFGAIYRATHIKSGHQIALKVLHREMASDPRVVARFRREGEALTSLRDPHTITAYEIGEADDGALYIVMELLHGESLYERFRARGPLPWRTMISIAHQICSSLAEAHARGIVHRDLKPANIHLEPREDEPNYVKVLDFGIAKILNGSGDTSDLTNAGQMIGTFDYMSPEQMVGECTTRSDIYTLGVLMYEMICGRRPFDDVAGPTGLLAALITRAPPSLASRAAVSEELDRVVMKCLEKEPEARYGDVHELQRALHKLLTTGPEASHDDDATRMLQLPSSGGGERALTPTPSLSEVDETRLHTAKAPPPLMRALSEEDTPTPVPGTPTPVYTGYAPPPGVPAPMPHAPSSPHDATMLAPPPVMPMPMTGPPMPGPPMPGMPMPYAAGPVIPYPVVQRPSSLEIRPFDMAAAKERDAWVGRVVWGTLILIALIVIGFLRC